MSTATKTIQGRGVVIAAYRCGGCGGRAYARGGHVRVEHDRSVCPRWEKLQKRFPGLALMIQRERVS